MSWKRLWQDWRKRESRRRLPRRLRFPELHAYTRVFYRGSWFYIEDSDLETKSTLSLFTQLLALQAGEEELLQPVLTLPVS